jgi:hypothetical protein
MNYHFTRFCAWFAHFTYVIANSTGMNPGVVRQYKREWDQWDAELQLLEIQR